MANCPCGYREYVAKPRTVRARQLKEPEVIQCYNRDRIGVVGDYVLLDEFDRVMLIREDNFKNTYEEIPNEIT